MMDLAARIVGMVVHRPYVFVFFTIYVVTAVTRLGWKRTALFTTIAYVVAFAAELSSTRNGFPFGLYHYIDVTRDRELWISNVPFWDSLSFTFLCYLGWRLAVLVYAPLAIAPSVFEVVETRAIATSWRVAITGAVFMTWLDVVIDPLTVLGEQTGSSGSLSLTLANVPASSYKVKVKNTGSTSISFSLAVTHC